MDETKPRRRWYRKKRWWAAGLLWAVAVYLLSFWPAGYAAGRGWISLSAAETLYHPVETVTHEMLPQPLHSLERRPDGSYEVVVTTPDLDPPPRVLSGVAEAYLGVGQWCYETGERHAYGAASP